MTQSNQGQKGTKLWEISEELEALELQISYILDDDSLEEEEKQEKANQVLEGWFNSEQAFKSKAEKVASYIKYQDALNKARREEGQRLYGLAKEAERKSKLLKDYLCYQMETSGINKVEGTSHKLSLRKQPAQLVFNVDYSEIPPEFVEVEYKPDRTAIKKHIKNNPDVDWAEMKETDKKGLTIK